MSMSCADKNCSGSKCIRHW